MESHLDYVLSARLGEPPREPDIEAYDEEGFDDAEIIRSTPISDREGKPRLDAVKDHHVEPRGHSPDQSNTSSPILTSEQLYNILRARRSDLDRLDASIRRKQQKVERCAAALEMLSSCRSARLRDWQDEKESVKRIEQKVAEMKSKKDFLTRKLVDEKRHLGDVRHHHEVLTRALKGKLRAKEDVLRSLHSEQNACKHAESLLQTEKWQLEQLERQEVTRLAQSEEIVSDLRAQLEQILQERREKKTSLSADAAVKTTPIASPPPAPMPFSVLLSGLRNICRSHRLVRHKDPKSPPLTEENDAIAMLQLLRQAVADLRGRKEAARRNAALDVFSSVLRKTLENVAADGK